MNDLPLNLDPELLVAYVDKELTPAQMAAVEAALMPALDDGAQGQAVAYAGKAGERGRIVLGRRFVTGFSAECREFTRSESRDGVASRAGGLACRSADGSWSVMLLPAVGS